jgi:DNA repair protein RadC
MKRVPRFEVRLVRTDYERYHVTKISGTDTAKVVAVDLMKNLLADSPNEKFVVVTLDVKHRPIGVHVITEGTLDASLVHPREVFQPAILSNAAAIICIHNHPSGDVEPSPQDRRVTDQLDQAGKILGIPMLDHLIVGVDPYSGEYRSASIREC